IVKAQTEKSMGARSRSSSRASSSVKRVLAAGEADGDAIAFPDHLEPGNGLAHLAEDDFLEFQNLYYKV
ncbi:MAG: hypothetical protein QM757_37995, partial [Paludibaculum sp.]